MDLEQYLSNSLKEKITTTTITIPITKIIPTTTTKTTSIIQTATTTIPTYYSANNNMNGDNYMIEILKL
jgi:hypothetical protein